MPKNPDPPMKSRPFYSAFRGPLRQVPAWVLCVTILFTGTPAQAGNAAPLPAPENKALSLIVPENLGILEESHSASSKTVIYLQDAHDSLEAQENIAALISLFVEREGVQTVFEEGYEGPVPSDRYFGTLKDASARELASYYLMDKLRIGGAEYAHINRKKEFTLMGSDDARLHRENIEWYRRAAALQEESAQGLEALEKEIRLLADRCFPESLKEWMKIKKRRDENQLSFGDYLQRLKDIAPEFFSELNRAEFEKKHPQLALLYQSPGAGVSDAGSMDPKEIFRELEGLENEISERLLNSERDRKIFLFYKGLELLKRLNALEISRDEYQALKGSLQSFSTEQFAVFISEQEKKSIAVSRRWEENLRNAVQFYETAHLRDAMIEKKMIEFKNNPEEKTAVLVFGGFHQSAIKDILKKQGLSYYVVSPKITEIKKTQRDLYRHLMTLSYDRRFEFSEIVSRATRAMSDFGVAGISNDYASRFEEEVQSLGRIAEEIEISGQPLQESLWQMEQAVARSELRAPEVLTKEILEEEVRKHSGSSLEVGGTPAAGWAVSTEKRHEHDLLRTLAARLEKRFPQYRYRYFQDVRTDQNYMRLDILLPEKKAAPKKTWKRYRSELRAEDPEDLGKQMEILERVLAAHPIPYHRVQDNAIYVPTPLPLLSLMFDVFKTFGPVEGKNYMEIGSGDGRNSLFAAIQGMNAVAIERDSNIAYESEQVLSDAAAAGLEAAKRVKLVQADALAAETDSYWQSADILFFFYTEPDNKQKAEAFRQELQEKMRSQMKPGAKLALLLTEKQLATESASGSELVFRGIPEFQGATVPLPMTEFSVGFNLQIYTAPGRSELRESLLEEKTDLVFNRTLSNLGGRSELRTQSETFSGHVLGEAGEGIFSFENAALVLAVPAVLGGGYFLAIKVFQAWIAHRVRSALSRGARYIARGSYTHVLKHANLPGYVILVKRHPFAMKPRQGEAVRSPQVTEQEEWHVYKALKKLGLAPFTRYAGKVPMRNMHPDWSGAEGEDVFRSDQKKLADMYGKVSPSMTGVSVYLQEEGVPLNQFVRENPDQKSLADKSLANFTLKLWKAGWIDLDIGRRNYLLVTNREGRPLKDADGMFRLKAHDFGAIMPIPDDLERFMTSKHADSDVTRGFFLLRNLTAAVRAAAVLFPRLDLKKFHEISKAADEAAERVKARGDMTAFRPAYLAVIDSPENKKVITELSIEAARLIRRAVQDSSRSELRAQGGEEGAEGRDRKRAERRLRAEAEKKLRQAKEIFRKRMVFVGFVAAALSTAAVVYWMIPKAPEVPAAAAPSEDVLERQRFGTIRGIHISDSTKGVLSQEPDLIDAIAEGAGAADRVRRSQIAQFEVSERPADSGAVESIFHVEAHPQSSVDPAFEDVTLRRTQGGKINPLDLQAVRNSVSGGRIQAVTQVREWLAWLPLAALGLFAILAYALIKGVRRVDTGSIMDSKNASDRSSRDIAKLRAAAEKKRQEKEDGGARSELRSFPPEKTVDFAADVLLKFIGQQSGVKLSKIGYRFTIVPDVEQVTMKNLLLNFWPEVTALIGSDDPKVWPEKLEGIQAGMRGRDVLERIRPMFLSMSRFGRHAAEGEEDFRLELARLFEKRSAEENPEPVRILVAGPGYLQEAVEVLAAADASIEALAVSDQSKLRLEVIVADQPGELAERYESNNLVYHSRDVSFLSETVRDRYLEAVPGGYRIRPEAHERLSFRFLDLNRHRDYGLLGLNRGSVDFVLNHNLEPYLNPRAVRRLSEYLHAAMRDEGVMYARLTAAHFDRPTFGLNGPVYWLGDLFEYGMGLGDKSKYPAQMSHKFHKKGHSPYKSSFDRGSWLSRTYEEEAIRESALDPEDEGWLDRVLGPARSELRAQAEIDRLFQLKETAKVRAAHMKKMNRELLELFPQYRALKKTPPQDDPQASEKALEGIRKYADGLEAFSGRVSPGAESSDEAGEKARYEAVRAMDPILLRDHSRALDAQIRGLLPGFVEAYGARDFARLAALNGQARALHKEKIITQVRQTVMHLRSKSPNESAVLALLMALHNTYQKLAQEYAWQWRRAVMKAGTERIRVVGHTGNVQTVYDYGTFRIFRVPAEDGERETVVMVQNRWKRYEHPDGRAAYRLEPVVVAFRDEDAEFRSQLHTLASQENDYSQLLFHINALDYAADLLKANPENVPAYVRSQIAEGLAEVLYGEGGLRRGKTTQKQEAAASVEAALAGIGQDRVSEPLGLIQDAIFRLQDRLKEIEGKRDGVFARAEYIAAEIRKRETYRAVTAVRELLDQRAYAEAEALLTLVYQTHYQPIGRAAPQYQAVKTHLARVRDRVRILAGSLAQEPQVLPGIREDLRRLELMTRTQPRSELRSDERQINVYRIVDAQGKEIGVYRKRIPKAVFDKLDNVTVRGFRVSDAVRMGERSWYYVNARNDLMGVPAEARVEKGLVTELKFLKPEGEEIHTFSRIYTRGDAGERRLTDVFPFELTPKKLKTLEKATVTQYRLDKIGSLMIGGRHWARFPKYPNASVEVDIDQGLITNTRIVNDQGTVLEEFPMMTVWNSEGKLEEVFYEKITSARLAKLNQVTLKGLFLSKSTGQLQIGGGRHWTSLEKHKGERVEADFEEGLVVTVRVIDGKGKVRATYPMGRIYKEGKLVDVYHRQMTPKKFKTLDGVVIKTRLDPRGAMTLGDRNWVVLKNYKLFPIEADVRQGFVTEVRVLDPQGGVLKAFPFYQVHDESGRIVEVFPSRFTPHKKEKLKKPGSETAGEANRAVKVVKDGEVFPAEGPWKNISKKDLLETQQGVLKGLALGRTSGALRVGGRRWIALTQYRGYAAEADIESGRVVTVRVLDPEGEVIKTVELPRVYENGQFVDVMRHGHQNKLDILARDVTIKKLRLTKDGVLFFANQYWGVFSDHRRAPIEIDIKDKRIVEVRISNPDGSVLETHKAKRILNMKGEVVSVFYGTVLPAQLKKMGKVRVEGLKFNGGGSLFFGGVRIYADSNFSNASADIVYDAAEGKVHEVHVVKDSEGNPVDYLYRGSDLTQKRSRMEYYSERGRVFEAALKWTLEILGEPFEYQKHFHEDAWDEPEATGHVPDFTNTAGEIFANETLHYIDAKFNMLFGRSLDEYLPIIRDRLQKEWQVDVENPSADDFVKKVIFELVYLGSNQEANLDQKIAKFKETFSAAHPEILDIRVTSFWDAYAPRLEAAGRHDLVEFLQALKNFHYKKGRSAMLAAFRRQLMEKKAPRVHEPVSTPAELFSIDAESSVEERRDPGPRSELRAQPQGDVFAGLKASLLKLMTAESAEEKNAVFNSVARSLTKANSSVKGKFRRVLLELLDNRLEERALWAIGSRERETSAGQRAVYRRLHEHLYDERGRLRKDITKLEAAPSAAATLKYEDTFTVRAGRRKETLRVERLTSLSHSDWSQIFEIYGPHNLRDFYRDLMAGRRNLSGNQNAVFVVRTSENKIAGFSWAFADPGKKMLGLAVSGVAKPYRGKGLAARLLISRLEWGLSNGLTYARTHVGGSGRINGWHWRLLSLGGRIDSLSLQSPLPEIGVRPEDQAAADQAIRAAQSKPYPHSRKPVESVLKKHPDADVVVTFNLSYRLLGSMKGKVLAENVRSELRASEPGTWKALKEQMDHLLKLYPTENSRFYELAAEEGFLRKFRELLLQYREAEDSFSANLPEAKNQFEDFQKNLTALLTRLELLLEEDHSAFTEFHPGAANATFGVMAVQIKPDLLQDETPRQFFFGPFSLKQLSDSGALKVDVRDGVVISPLPEVKGVLADRYPEVMREKLEKIRDLSVSFLQNYQGPRSELRSGGREPVQESAHSITASEFPASLIETAKFPKTLAAFLSTLGTLSAAAGSPYLQLNLKEEGKKFLFETLKTSLAAGFGETMNGFTEQDVDSGAYVVRDEKTAIPLGILYRFGALPIFFDFVELADPDYDGLPLDGQHLDAWRRADRISRGLYERALGQVHLLERITLTELSERQSRWMSEDERRKKKLNQEILSLYVISEIQDWQRKSDIFLRPDQKGSLDFQRLLFRLKEQRPEFFDGTVGIAGSGTGVDSLLSVFYGAKSVRGSELYALIKILGELNINYAKEADLIPENTPIVIERKEGLPSGSDIKTLFFNTPVVIRDGQRTTFMPANFSLPARLLPSTGAILMEESDFKKILSEASALLKGSAEKRAVMRMNLDQFPDARNDVRSYLAKAEAYLEAFGLSLTGYYGETFVEFQAGSYGVTGKWQYVQSAFKALEQDLQEASSPDAEGQRDILLADSSAEAILWFIERIEEGLALKPDPAAVDQAQLQAMKQTIQKRLEQPPSSRSELRMFINDLVRQQFAIAGVPFLDEHIPTDAGVFRPTLSGHIDPLAEYAGSYEPVRIIDMGSGQGAMVFAFARANERAEVLGIEYDEKLFNDSVKVRNSFFEDTKRRIRLERGDFNDPKFVEDIQKADLINYWESGARSEDTMLQNLANHMRGGARFLVTKNIGRFIRIITDSGYFDLVDHNRDEGIFLYKRNEKPFEGAPANRSELRSPEDVPAEDDRPRSEAEKTFERMKAVKKEFRSLEGETRTAKGLELLGFFRETNLQIRKGVLVLMKDIRHEMLPALTAFINSAPVDEEGKNAVSAAIITAGYLFREEKDPIKDEIAELLIPLFQKRPEQTDALFKALRYLNGPAAREAFFEKMKTTAPEDEFKLLSEIGFTRDPAYIVPLFDRAKKSQGQDLLEERKIPYQLSYLITPEWVAAHLEDRNVLTAAYRFGYFDRPVYEALKEPSAEGELWESVRTILNGVGIVTETLLKAYQVEDPSLRSDLVRVWRSRMMEFSMSFEAERLFDKQKILPLKSDESPDSRQERDLYFAALREHDLHNVDEKLNVNPFDRKENERIAGRYFFLAAERFEQLYQEGLRQGREAFNAEAVEPELQEVLLPYYAASFLTLESQTQNEARANEESIFRSRWRTIAKILVLKKPDTGTEGSVRITFKPRVWSVLDALYPAIFAPSIGVSDEEKTAALVSRLSDKKYAEVLMYGVLDAEPVWRTRIFMENVTGRAAWEELSYGARAALQLYAYSLFSSEPALTLPQAEEKFDPKLQEILADERILKQHSPSIGIELQNTDVLKDRIYSWKQALEFLGIPSPYRPEYYRIVEAAFPPAWSPKAFLLAVPILIKLGYHQTGEQESAFHISVAGDLGKDSRYLAFPLLSFRNDRLKIDSDDDWFSRQTRVMSKGLIHRNRESREPDPASQSPGVHTEFRTARLDYEDPAQKLLNHSYEIFLPGMQAMAAALAASGKDASLRSESENLLAGIWENYRRELDGVYRDEKYRTAEFLDADWFESTGDPEDSAYLKKLPIMQTRLTLRHFFQAHDEALAQELHGKVREIFTRYAGLAENSLRSELRAAESGVNLREFVEAAVHRHTWPDKITVEIDPGLKVSMDKADVSTAVFELLKNAVDGSRVFKKKSGKDPAFDVLITASQMGEWVSLHITNRGIVATDKLRNQAKEEGVWKLRTDAPRPEAWPYHYIMESKMPDEPMPYRRLSVSEVEALSDETLLFHVKGLTLRSDENLSRIGLQRSDLMGGMGIGLKLSWRIMENIDPEKPISYQAGTLDGDPSVTFTLRFPQAGSVNRAELRTHEGAAKPAQLDPEQIYLKDPLFLKAVAYFNEHFSAAGQTKVLPPVTWADVITLYELIRGDDANPGYTQEDRRLRLSHGDKPWVLDWLQRMNAEASNSADALDSALRLYRFSSEGSGVSQMFVGLPGFNRVRPPKKEGASFDPHPADGHHRLAWFIMNYYLIRNGYEPFYFESEKEYLTIPIDYYNKDEGRERLRELLAQRVFHERSELRSGESGAAPEFIDPAKVYSKRSFLPSLQDRYSVHQSPEFLGAVDYFNQHILERESSGEVPVLDWPRMMALYERIRGDGENPDYTEEERLVRLSHESEPWVQEWLSLINQRADNAGEAESLAVRIYRYSSEGDRDGQLLIGKQGFTRIRPRQDEGSVHFENAPADGHHRLAWFLMNFFLIRNGYPAFYFENGREYSEVPVNSQNGTMGEHFFRQLLQERVFSARSELRDKPVKENFAVEEMAAPAAVFLDAFELVNLKEGEADERFDELLTFLDKHPAFDVYIDHGDRYPVHNLPLAKLQKLLNEYPERIHIGEQSRANLTKKKIVLQVSLRSSGESAEQTGKTIEGLRERYQVKSEIIPVEYLQPGALKGFLDLAESFGAAELLKQAGEAFVTRNANGRWSLAADFAASLWAKMQADYTIQWSA